MIKKSLSIINLIFLGTPWRKRIFLSLIGASAGYAYYHFIGCYSGTCPISGNPWISTLYGAGIGLVLSISEKKKSPGKD
jgi:hypothetical protein